MSSTPPPAPDAELDALAMDYALGSLTRSARKAAEVRMASNADFRDAVAGWQELLGPLNEAIVPVTPPPGLWAAIAAEVQPAPRAAAPPAPQRGWWHNLAFWRGLGIGGPVLAAIVAGLAAMPPAAVIPAPAAVAAGPAAAGPALVATLADSEGRPLLAAAFDPADGAVRFAPVAQGPEQDGKVPQLWVIEGGAAPKSLGVIDISAGSSHAIPRERLAGLKPGAILAISIEPTGGSPTGAPTGPVIATGALSAA